MTESLIISYPPAGSTWVFHPPTDPWGDRYVAVVGVELRDRGLHAENDVTLSWPSGRGETDLVSFFQRLADGWRGWNGERTWRSLGGELQIAAEHDGTGYVTLTAVLRADPTSSDAWRAQVSITVEAGEQMRSLASEVRAHFVRLTE